MNISMKVLATTASLGEINDQGGFRFPYLVHARMDPAGLPAQLLAHPRRDAVGFQHLKHPPAEVLLQQLSAQRGLIEGQSNGAIGIGEQQGADARTRTIRVFADAHHPADADTIAAGTGGTQDHIRSEGFGQV